MKLSDWVETQGIPDEDIAEVLKTSRRTIERVRQRFVTEG